MAVASAPDRASALAALHDRVEHDLTLHPPRDGLVAERLDEIRTAGKEFAHTLIACVDLPCRELSMALTDVEDAVQHAIAGIVRNQEHG